MLYTPFTKKSLRFCCEACGLACVPGGSVAIGVGLASRERSVGEEDVRIVSGVVRGVGKSRAHV
ncbi:MAG: hypothetical protein MR415_00095 [Coriobacteriaceae bacterium]|nr:hypothetical protein [Coriobacteriaceae bacterium]